jgi:hypothetical protein
MRLRLNTILIAVGMFLYLAAAVGIPVFQHYCGGELENVSAYTKPDSCCGDEENEPSDCCHNEIQVAKLDAQSSHKTTARLQTVPSFISNFLIPQIVSTDSFQSVSITTIARADTSPPPLLHKNIIDTAVLRI